MVKSTKILGHGYRIDEPITFRRYSLHRKIRPSEFYLWTNTARIFKKKRKSKLQNFTISLMKTYQIYLCQNNIGM